MTERREYISALRQCAKEHENDKLYTGQVNTSDLCNDTANLLENGAVEREKINKAIEEITKLRDSCNRMITEEATLVNACYEQYADCYDECLKIIQQNTEE